MDQWNNSASGLWSTGSNWSSNQPPDSTFALILITNANTKTVTVDATTAATNLAIQRMTISAPVGSVNTLALAGVNTNRPLQLSLGLTVDGGGALTLTNSALNSAGVSVNPRVERAMSRVWTRSSSRVIRFVTTEGATSSSRAAAEKLPSRATTRNALMFRMVLMAHPALADTPASLTEKADRAF